MPDGGTSDRPLEFRLPAGVGEATWRERGSRFIARAARAEDPAAALHLRDGERSRYHDATHHVLAARTLGGEVLNDDGEPSGTAARPILVEIERANVYGVAIVVTRYFGGTKLGTGGLARAYGSAAAAAIEELATVRGVTARVMTVRFAYADTGVVMRALDASDARRRSARYAEESELELGVPVAQCPELAARLVELTAGRARITFGDELVLETGDDGGEIEAEFGART